jgi:hypothetical protein
MINYIEKIRLELYEWKIANFLNEWREKNTKDHYRDLGNKEDSTRTNLQSIVSEIAWCKMLNVYPGAIFDQSKSRSREPDWILADGRTVDVKSTRSSKSLNLSVQVKNHYDIYASFKVVYPYAWYMGWAFRSHLIRPENYRYGTNGRSDYYALDFTELNRMKFF